jgi:hypothetical protein
MGDQACWNRSKALAAARGGARAGKPRWVRILAALAQGVPGAEQSFETGHQDAHANAPPTCTQLAPS